MESTLTFSRPTISEGYTGYLGFYQVISSSGDTLADYDAVQLRSRVLAYSKARCTPYQIVYPDIQLVVEYYEKGQLLNRSLYVNGGKLLDRVLQFGPASTTVAEYRYKNDRVHGRATFYHPDGSLNYELNYTDGQRNGCFESHYPSGARKAIGCFHDDHLVGDYQHYFDDGQLEIDSHYSTDGRLEGEYAEYYQNGLRKIVATYISGLLTGNYVEYFPSGETRVEAFYQAGEIVGTGHTYFESGKVEEVYRNTDHGSHVRYFEDGTVRSEVPLVEGRYDGAYTEYYPTGTINLTAQYDHGVVIGEVRAWSETGNLTRVAQYSNGRVTQIVEYYPHGGASAVAHYSVDGGLSEIEYYDLFGSLELSVPYSSDKISGTVKRFYRDGTVAAAAKYEHGKIVNPVVGYRPDGAELFRIDYGDTGELTAAVVYSETGSIQHYIEATDEGTVQYELYPDQTAKFISLVSPNGDEQREYYARGSTDALLSQSFSAHRGLTEIAYDMGETALGCVLSDTDTEYYCGTIDEISGDVQLMDTEMVLSELAEWIEQEDLSKPNLPRLLDIQSPEGLLQQHARRVAKSLIQRNDRGQSCYDLGFTEWCE